MSDNWNPNNFINIQSEEEFNDFALHLFDYQYHNLSIYRKFCDSIQRCSPSSYSDIPFLPISFFKTHRVVSKEVVEDKMLVFKSSGTTQSGERSNHFVPQPQLYEESFKNTFVDQITEGKEAIIFALLPNYMEQGDSSLIYMVDYLIRASQHPLSGFYMKKKNKLLKALEKAKKSKKRVILFGVAYALLDLIDEGVDLSGVFVIETGGMKGRRKEMVKEELHEHLKKGLHLEKIYSEYGMTELLSQAYTDGSTYFTPPKWMKVLIRDINDPLQLRKEGKTGGVNIIDLANVYSCSFIATDDLGKKRGNQFQILGRFDESDIRGCNLLVN